MLPVYCFIGFNRKVSENRVLVRRQAPSTQTPLSPILHRFFYFKHIAPTLLATNINELWNVVYGQTDVTGLEERLNITVKLIFTSLNQSYTF